MGRALSRWTAQRPVLADTKLCCSSAKFLCVRGGLNPLVLPAIRLLQSNIASLHRVQVLASPLTNPANAPVAAHGPAAKWAPMRTLSCCTTAGAHAACLGDVKPLRRTCNTGKLAGLTQTQPSLSTFSFWEMSFDGQVPNAGRGLAAGRVVAQGTVVHVENPMLCYPSLAHVDKVCLHTRTRHTSCPDTSCIGACKLCGSHVEGDKCKV